MTNSDYNAEVQSGHGWRENDDGEKVEYWHLVINQHHIEVSKRIFDEVNRAMRRSRTHV